MRRLIPFLLLAGCPKRYSNPNHLIGTKWTGQVTVTTPCENGGYGGNDLMVCAVFRSINDEGMLQVDVDWDPNSLKDACDYFQFEGTSHRGLTLTRTDDVEQTDDQFSLRVTGDRMTGQFQVHASCQPWQVDLRLVP